jgi:hypothetical protein
MPDDYGIPDAGMFDFNPGGSQLGLLPRAFQIDPGLMEPTVLNPGQQLSRSLNDATGFIGRVFQNPALLGAYQENAGRWDAEDRAAKQKRLSIAMGQASMEQQQLKAHQAQILEEQKRQEKSKEFVAQHIDDPIVVVNPDGTRRPATPQESTHALFALHQGDMGALKGFEWRPDLRKVEETKATHQAANEADAAFLESAPGRREAALKRQDAASQAAATAAAGTNARLATESTPENIKRQELIHDARTDKESGADKLKSPAAKEFVKESYAIMRSAENASMKPDLEGNLPSPKLVNEQGRKFAIEKAAEWSERIVQKPELRADVELLKVVAKALPPESFEAWKQNIHAAAMQQYPDIRTMPDEEWRALAEVFGEKKK